MLSLLTFSSSELFPHLNPVSKIHSFIHKKGSACKLGMDVGL